MSKHPSYVPGPAAGAEVRKAGDVWTLVLVRDLERLLAGAPIGRIVGVAAMSFDGWQRLTTEYSKQLGVEPSEGNS